MPRARTSRWVRCATPGGKSGASGAKPRSSNAETQSVAATPRCQAPLRKTRVLYLDLEAVARLPEPPVEGSLRRAVREQEALRARVDERDLSLACREVTPWIPLALLVPVGQRRLADEEIGVSCHLRQPLVRSTVPRIPEHGSVR